MDATKTHEVHDLAHNSPLISCRFDPSGRFVFAGAQDYRVLRWDVETKTKTELTAVDSWVRGITFSHDGKTLITGGYDGRLLWCPVDADELKPSLEVAGHHGWIRAVAVSPDGTLLASVGNDMVVRLWNLNDGKLVREMKGHESHIYNVAFHPDGKQLATGDLMCNVIHWDVASGEQKRAFQAKSMIKFDKTFIANIGGVRSMSFNEDGSRLAVSGITNVTNAFAGVGNPSVVVFDWAKGEQKIEHLSKGKFRGVAWGVSLHATGITIAAAGGGGGGQLLFWKQDEADEFHTMKLKDTARDLAVSPDGMHVATAHHDGHVRVHLMDAKPA